MSDAAAWTPGSLVEGHRLVRVLGRGGMGEVWLVEHVPTGAERALKVLRGAFAAEDVARFRREVDALAKVDGHPNVVRVHAAGVHARCPWVVMERVPGGDLEARLEGGPLEPAVAAALVRDLARGLAHVHAHGVLHRDLKPANILLDERAVPVLVDFGLARLHGAESLTQTGTVLGTPTYMAPEQARGDRVDERADVYGLGAIFYHTLCGRSPFSGRSPIEVLAKVCEGRMTPPSAVRRGLPRELEAICLRALALDPDARWPGAAALGRELDAWLARGGRAARSGRPVLALAIVAVVVVAIAAAAVVTTPAPGATSRVPPSPASTSSAPADVASGAVATSSSALPLGKWAQRFASGEHLEETRRPTEFEYGSNLGQFGNIARQLKNAREATLEKLAKGVLAGDPTAQRHMGELRLAHEEREEGRELLWLASRGHSFNTHAGVILGLDLLHDPDGDREGAVRLFDEAEARIDEGHALDNAPCVARLACAFVHLGAPRRAVDLLDRSPSPLALHEELEYLQRQRDDPVRPCASFLEGVACLRGLGGPLDVEKATRRFHELESSTDEGARAAAAQVLRELPAWRVTWDQRFEREARREVKRIGVLAFRTDGGPDPSRDLAAELGEPSQRDAALAVLERGVSLGDAESERIVGEFLLRTRFATDHALGLHLLWLASRDPEPDEHAGIHLATHLIHGPEGLRDLDCAQKLLREAGRRAGANRDGFSEPLVAELASDLVHLGQDDAAIELIEALPRRAEVAASFKAHSESSSPLAPCSAVLDGIARLRGWTGTVDVPAARARFEALLETPDASAAAAARTWLESAR